ncbi:MAG TPA: hypothetical protein PK323_04265 [Bacteroidia bacterium]|nr:hypothetical protein [Bacteroidia bacterium]
MLRYIFILLNVALLAGIRGLSGDSKTTITQYIPNSALTGTEFMEEIVISKPTTVNSFAKFEQQLPKGMVAVGSDIKGGVLTQDENNLVKIVWYKISDLDQFTIKLRILVDHETSINEYALSSRFAYLENNTRYEITSASSKISIEKGAPKQLDENEKELVKVADTTLHRALTDNIDKMLREAGVACTQVSEMLSKSEAKVDIRVIKGKVSGFAKIEEPICEGVTAINIDNGGGVFSFVDGKVKYVWTDLPAGQNVTVSYKLVRNKEAGWLNRCTVEGDFSYLEGEKSLRCNFNSITVDFEKGVTVSNVPMPANAAAQMAVNENKANETEQNKAVAVSNSNERISSPEQQTTAQKEIEAMHEKTKEADVPKNELETNVAAKSEQNTNAIAKENSSESKSTSASTNNNASTASPTTSTPVAGLVFKVQVCATHRTVDATFVKNNYKLTEEVVQEMHEGWFKFTVGGYGQYVEARNKREELAPFNLPGPFVTAYNNGNRITVQEALMISKQQWVK